MKVPMKKWIAVFLLVFAAAAPAADKPDYKVGDRLPAAADKAKSAYREVGWDDLLPKGWDPMASFKGLDLSKMKDSDPRADEAMRNLRRAWDAAPANEDMNGAKVRIAGFLVPLEWGDKKLKEFVLVPYFGACIHVPPPPVNQIIHVVADTPAKGMQAMEAVWVEGTLEVALADTTMGKSSYKMKARSVTKYKK